MLAGNDERGTYYAVRTFMQLFHEGHLPFVGIQDYPDVRFRGVVEGFYGTPWSHEARLRQLQFYGENKLNTYIYGPKDDPFHSSPNWRKPYPAKEGSSSCRAGEGSKRERSGFRVGDSSGARHPLGDIRP